MPDHRVRNQSEPVRSGQLNDKETLDAEVEERFAEFAARDLLSLNPQHFGTILADPPWRFANRSGKMAPEHVRLHRYPTMSFEEIMELPISRIAKPQSHLYLWCPNALLQEGLEVMRRWGFTYKTNIVWFKIRKDGGPDGRGVGFYFRNVTELVLVGVRGGLRTSAPGRRQVNIIKTQKREHSRKPDELYEIIEDCSPAPYIELFARQRRPGWAQWGNEVDSRQMQAFKPQEQMLLELRERQLREEAELPIIIHDSTASIR